MFRFDFIIQSYARFQNLMRMAGLVFLFTLFIGSIIHLLEPHNFPTVFDGLWWSVVSISTVGYGDFVPETVLGRILGIILIITGIAIFSFFITNLASSTILTRQERERGRVSHQKEGHYIIVGWNERSHELIKQLQHIHPQLEIVLVDETLQKKPDDCPKVIFIKGSPQTDSTFERANARKAHTVIITSNLHLDEKSADANAVLTLLTVKGIHPAIYAIVELMTKNQVKNAERAGADEIVQSSNHLSLLMINGILFHGMTGVIEKMLTHGEKDQLVFRDLPSDLYNKNFNEAIENCQTKDSFLIGIQRENETILHPKSSSRLLKGDLLIFFNRMS